MVALSVTATSVTLNTGKPLQGTLLGTVTAGMALYADGTRGQFGPSVGAGDANGAAALRTCVGVALNGGAIGQPVLYAGTDGDVVSFGAILTANTCYIQGATTPGDINPIADITTGWYLSTIGFATTTSLMTIKLFSSGVAS